MLFNLLVVLLGVASFSAALPMPQEDVSSIAARHAQPQTEIVQEEVIVYEDAAGQPDATSTIPGVPISTSTPTPTPSPASSNKLQQDTNTADTLGAASLTGSPFTSGVTYTPKFANGDCKDAAQVATDIQDLVSKGNDLIRIYDVVCNGPQSLQAALKGTNTWMFLGILTIDSAVADANSIATQLGNDWSQVHTVAVGNEVVQDGGSPGAVVAAIGSVRSTLRGLGYTGPVVTVDTAVVVETNPELCQNSDYCAVNCHAFWDGNAPNEADNTINYHVSALKKATGMDKVVITETGWPTCGGGDGAATASPQSQAEAITSLKTVAGVDMIFFSGYNELWKTNFAGSFGAEQCWGIYGDAPSGA